MQISQRVLFERTIIIKQIQIFRFVIIFADVAVWLVNTIYSLTFFTALFKNSLFKPTRKICFFIARSNAMVATAQCSHRRFPQHNVATVDLGENSGQSFNLEQLKDEEKGGWTWWQRDGRGAERWKGVNKTSVLFN